MPIRHRKGWEECTQKTKTKGETFMQKLTNLITWLSRGRWQVVPTQTVETLQTEIDRLEDHLLALHPQPTRSNLNLRELQKFVDLAG